MTELELYKYINDNNIEWHWQENDGVDDVLIMPKCFELLQFSDLVKSITNEDGYVCILKDGYVCIWMQDICDYYGIEITNVFKDK
jgi:hypothetical protein